MRRGWLAGVLVGCLALPPQAFAQSEPSSQPASQPQSAPTVLERPEDRERAITLFGWGQEYYQAKEYERALISYEAAYELSRAPSLIFNMAQCYRLLGRQQEALSFYRAFLAEVPETPYRQEIEERIATLEAALSPAPKAEAATLEVFTPLPTREEEPRVRPEWRFALAGALLGGGTAFGLSSLALSQNFDSQERLFDTGRRLSLATEISLTAAAVTFGSIFLMKRQRAVTAAPTARGLSVGLRQGAPR